MLPTRGAAWSRKASATAGEGPAQFNTTSRVAPKRMRVVPILATSEERLPDAPRENVIDVKVELSNRAHVVARSRVCGNQRLESDLEIGTRPDDAGADDACRKTLLAAVMRGLEVELHLGVQ